MKKRSMTTSFLLVLILALLAMGPASAVRAQQVKKDTGKDQLADRIGRVENGLLPSVIIKDRQAAAMNIADRMKFYNTPGVSIAVINNGKIEWARGYGVKKAGTDETVKPDTLFQAASISKPVAAVAGLRLVEQGKLDLDADVNQWLASWQVPNNEFTQNGGKVTLRGLLSHSAGLTVHGFRGYATSEQMPTLVQILNGEKPANSAPIRVDIAPGSRWRYSGGGYTVFQQLIEDMTKKPFPQLMRDMVLKPIGMRRSTYEQPLPQALRPQAAGHDGKGITVAGDFHTYPEMAAAGLWTTPSDLARFAIEVQRSLSGKSNKLLSRKMAEQLLTAQKGEWGLGLTLSGAGAASRFGHGGSNEGFRCSMIAYSKTGQGAVVMTNGDGGAQLGREILFSIAKEYGWADYSPTERTLANIDPQVFNVYTGEYEISPTLVITLTLEGDKLIASVAGQRLELLPESETRFFTLSNITVEFFKDPAGKVTHLLLDKTNRARKIK